MSAAPAFVQYRLPAGLPDTPSDAFHALTREKHAFWLDSGDAPGPHARYHFLGCAPQRTFSPERSPLEAMRELLRELREGPIGSGGVPAARVVGYVAYDLGRTIERVPDPGPGGPGSAPELWLAVYDACLTFDMETREAWITGVSRVACAALEQALERPRPAGAAGPLARGPLQTAVTADAYAAQVQEVRALIAAGDTYQVNLSHRFATRLADGVRADDVYQRLRARHPAPYGAYLDAGAVAVVSNSPEGLLEVDLRPGSRRVATWPLKGTRPRSADPEELRRSAKEQAEHVMIVDLERNDLGRIAVPGSVRVPQLLDVVAHSTVYHLESRVEATPRPGVDLVDILRATFPGGSITGAPKIRAMEIIADLERERRGVYCGALGYVGWDGLTSRWSIPIRTALVAQTGPRRGELSLRVGGGIVADSDPALEYQETLVKARAFMDVLAPQA